jgi:hypothetical protein
MPVEMNNLKEGDRITSVDGFWGKVIRLDPSDETVLVTWDKSKATNWCKIRRIISFQRADETDAEKYPHKCPLCSSPAYIGVSSVDCSFAVCALYKS